MAEILPPIARVSGPRKAAIDIALMDWVGQKLGVPLYRYFGLDPAGRRRSPPSPSASTRPRSRGRRSREAEAFPVLKIKVGLATDEATIDGRPQRHQEAAARGRQRGLERQGRGRPQDQLAGVAGRGVHRAAHARRHDRGDPLGAQPRAHPDHRRRGLPCTPADIPKLADAFDGVNIKLDKSRRDAGGLPA